MKLPASREARIGEDLEPVVPLRPACWRALLVVPGFMLGLALVLAAYGPRWDTPALGVFAAVVFNRR